MNYKIITIILIIILAIINIVWSIILIKRHSSKNEIVKFLGIGLGYFLSIFWII